MSKTIIDITPDKSLIQKLGRTGYRTEAAISELIDNSIDARLDGRPGRIDVVLDYEEKQITVSDNGSGMSLQDLQRGLIVARSSKPKDGKIGRFGFGMKSACSALGKKFVITTTTADSDLEYMAHYDEDEWLEDSTKTWKNFEVETKKKTRSWHGTKITITGIKVALYTNQTSMFKEKFGMRYGSYIKLKQIELHVNTMQCDPLEVPVLAGSKRDLCIKLASGKVMKGWIGLLERRSIRGDYGIHLYKNKRLIKAFEKFGIPKHPEVARLIGELHLDHVPTNFHKTGFIEDSGEYVEAMAAFESDSDVGWLLKDLKSRTSSGSILSLKDYFEKGRSSYRIKTKVGRSIARSLLDKIPDFDFVYDSKKIDFCIENGNSDSLYRIEKTRDGHKIIMNRNSIVFDTTGNPLFLAGMIGLEAMAMMDDPERHKNFIEKRNKIWSKFIRDCGDRIRGRTKKRRAFPSKYSLEYELDGLARFLQRRFEFGFKFTSLSTLASYLHNVYNKSVFTIYAQKYTGEYLCDLINKYNDGEFVGIFNPKADELKNALEYTPKDKIIIIRESSQKFTNTLASPEEAWIDLFLESKKGRTNIHKSEVPEILHHMLQSGLIDPERLRSVSKRRNVLEKIKPWMGAS